MENCCKLKLKYPRNPAEVDENLQKSVIFLETLARLLGGFISVANNKQKRRKSFVEID